MALDTLWGSIEKTEWIHLVDREHRENSDINTLSSCMMREKDLKMKQSAFLAFMAVY